MNKDRLTISLPNHRAIRKDSNISYKQFNLSNIKPIVINKYATVITYGCQGNERDGEYIRGILLLLGYILTDNLAAADLIILNSCAVREKAEDRLIGELGRLKSYKDSKPSLIIGIGGCVLQLEQEIQKILKHAPHLDFIFGPTTIHHLPNILIEVLDNNKQVIDVDTNDKLIVENLPSQREYRHKALVNIMYGCDKFCTYCIVPYTRGAQRSRKAIDILNEVKQLVEEGCIEITLVGQNVNAYGKDSENEITFASLLEQVALTGIKRLRFITSHPWDFNIQLLDVMKKYSNIMPQIHFPVQSGSDKILKAMNRNYTRNEYIKNIINLRNYIPHIAITTDIIVGFPGETIEDFIETLSLVEEVKFDASFTFIFSPRPYTPAYNMNNDISEEEKKRRLAVLNEKINEIALNINRELVDQVVEIMVEGVSKRDENVYSGYTKTNKLVNFTSEKKLNPGELVAVQIGLAKTHTLEGKHIYQGEYYDAYLLQEYLSSLSFVKEYVFLREKIKTDPLLKGMALELAKLKHDQFSDNSFLIDQITKDIKTAPMVVNFENYKNKVEDLLKEITAYLKAD